uniref:Thioredoxin domain-containing protein n=1 Tax=Picea sitchensis TaxID=3332 RepID=A9NPF4_PICSI|nr:unknown [Picea sitchensis]
MDAQKQITASRVLLVDSDKSWDIILRQAQVQACPVVVHFTADWCAPSKYMTGFFENLALKYPRILFLLVDVDEVKGVKDKMDVKAMPTFLLMKDDVQVDKIVGANADELQKRVAVFAQMNRQSAQEQA